MPRVGDRFRNVEAEALDVPDDDAPSRIVGPGEIWIVATTPSDGIVRIDCFDGYSFVSLEDLAQDFEPVAEGRAE